MAKIESFRDLNVYRLAMELQQEVFALSKGFPREELYSLTDQIRRASRAIGANVAESWHKRRYPAHFVSKLTDADAEQAETQHWLDTAFACEYLVAARHKVLLQKCERIGRMLGTMMNQADAFCRKAASGGAGTLGGGR
jgi:four helix bundle protein